MVFESFLFGLIGALTFGFADFLAAIVARKIGIFRVLIWNHIVSVGLPTIYLLFAADLSQVSSTHWLALIGLSILTFITLIGFYRALQLGPVSVISPIVSAGAVVSLLLAVTLLGERLSTGQTLGASVALGGVVLTSTDIRDLRGGNGLFSQGVLLGLGTMLAGGFLVFSTGRLSQELGWFLPVYLIRLITLVMLAPIQISRHEWPWHGLSIGLIFGVMLIGILQMGGMFVLARGMEVGAISIVSATLSVYPIVAIVGGLVIFRERLAPNQFLGLVSVLAGIIVLGVMT